MAKKKRLTREQVNTFDTMLLKSSYLQGWMVNPECITVGTVSALLMAQAVNAQLAWIHNVQQGRAPGEDISPSEGYLLMAYFVRELASRAKMRSMKPRALIEKYHSRFKKLLNEADIDMRKELNTNAPGYFEVPEGGNA